MKRGFTIVELMIGLLIGSFSVLVAAHVATMIVQQAAKGRQATDFNSRARVVSRQLRNDIRLAGVGTTGAITADRTIEPWGSIIGAQTGGAGGGVTTLGYDAFPAVTGANNVAGGAAGTTILGGSDALMLVVAIPTSHAPTIAIARAGESTLLVPAATDFSNWNCPFVLIVDHSTPSGSGRSQIATFAGSSPGSIDISPDNLQFSVETQSDVMCARVSTYWVANTNGDDLGNYLARSDLVAGTPPTMIGQGVAIQAGPNDLIAPGVLDLQIAYGFSSEIFTASGLALPTDPNAPWAFDGVPGVGPPVNDTFDFFEARQVRFTLTAKRMRAIDNFASSTLSPLTRAEDGGAAFATLVPNAVQPEALVTSEIAINLRYFDFGNPAGVAAEPY